MPQQILGMSRFAVRRQVRRRGAADQSRMTEAPRNQPGRPARSDANRKVDAVIARFATATDMPTLPTMMPDIDRCFSAESVAEIETKLKAHGGAWAEKQLATLLKLSPLAMAITLEQLKRCANRSFEDSMTIEYRMSQHCMRPDHDFFEGVRALLIDKDQKPKWNPPTIGGVTQAMVEAHFKPVSNDLLFD